MEPLELTFLYGESVPECRHRIDKRFSGYYTLQYMSAGAVELSIGPARRVIEGRWFWSAYPGPKIQFNCAPGHESWRHRYIAFKGPRVAEWTAEGLFPIAAQPAPGNADYGATFDELLKHSARTDRWGARRAAHLLEGMLIELAEARSAAPHEKPWLRLVTTRLEAAANEESPDYEALAAELGMGETTLRRRFRKATGISPHAFLLQCRISAAKRLLGETHETIKSIAEKLGYRDVYFFSRQFSRFAGVSPATYRKSREWG